MLEAEAFWIQWGLLANLPCRALPRVPGSSPARSTTATALPLAYPYLVSMHLF